MSRLSLPLSLVILISSAHLIQAQCVTPSYVPCFPAGTESGGSSGVPQDDFDDTGFWDSLQSVASAPIGKRNTLRHQLSSRQNALCCAPTNLCLILTEGNIPFCYNQDTTRYFFSDDSFGFVSNGTYYAADGTFVDFKDGYFSSTDGTTGTFAAATAAATSGVAGAAATSDTIPTAPKNTASPLATHSPAVSSSVGSPQHSLVTAPTTTPTAKSSGVTNGPSSAKWWLGLHVLVFGMVLA